MIRPILAYGNPILKQISTDVDINNEDVSMLIDDMWETMYNANGVGLAAPQIGILKKIFIADFDYFQEEDSFNKSEIEKLQQVFINPIMAKIVPKINSINGTTNSTIANDFLVGNGIRSILF